MRFAIKLIICNAHWCSNTSFRLVGGSMPCAPSAPFLFLFLLLAASLRSFLCLTNCLNCCSFCLMHCMSCPICSRRLRTRSCCCWIRSLTVSWFWKNLVLLWRRNWEAVSEEYAAASRLGGRAGCSLACCWSSARKASRVWRPGVTERTISTPWSFSCEVFFEKRLFALFCL